MTHDYDQYGRSIPSLVNSGAIERGIRRGNQLRAEAIKDMFARARNGLRTRA